MGNDIRSKVAGDLLSVPMLVFRMIRRKLINVTLADMDIDIKFPHIEVMGVLREEGTLHVAEIGHRLQIAKAQMTHLIDKLVDLEMVERNVDAADRRTINISLTAKGRDVVQKHESVIFNAVTEYISCLDEQDLETLSVSLRNLRDILFKLQ